MKPLLFSMVLVTTTVLSACGPSPTNQALSAAPIGAADGTPGADLASLTVTVYKNPSCGCCRGWIQHMQGAGFRVRVENVGDPTPIRQRLGVPAETGSCHTAQVGRYFVEGHVPAEDVKRLLVEHISAKGLVAPGMPVGSPGMPGLPGREPAYDVLLVAPDGSTSVFAHHGGRG